MSHSATGNFADASDNQMEEGVRGCTCPPSERPETCMKKYALSDCHKAAASAWVTKVIEDACKGQLIYYLKSIERNLEELDKITRSECQPSIGGEALADNRNWLSCYIDQLERRK